MSSANDSTANALRDVFLSDLEPHHQLNLVDTVHHLAIAVGEAASSLGLGGAATPMGAIEVHAKAIPDAADRIGSAIETLADAIRDLKA